MDTKPLDAIKGQLQQQQAKLAAHSDRLRADLGSLDDERGRIDAALAALAGIAFPAVNGKKKREKRKASTPSPNTIQVVALIAEELAQHHEVQEEDLKARVERKLVDSGHTRMGYSLRFNEAIASSQFVRAANGIRLNSTKTANG